MAKLSPLASVSETRAVLAAHGLSTKYSLGQNFLINDGILQKIIALSAVKNDETILEVGPGIGTLTIALLKNAARVVSVERDPDLPAVLAETCANWADRFALISKDALDLTVDDMQTALANLDPAQSRCPLPTKLVANLPYAVAATVVLDYFENFSTLESATVMVQKEVADRMAANPGSKNYGAYTVKLRLYAEPVGRFAVGPGNFFPPPRVESAVLRLDRRPVFDHAGKPLSEAALRSVCIMAEAGFATRRKTLMNSCKTYFSRQGQQNTHAASIKQGLHNGQSLHAGHALTRLPQLFEQANIDPKRRGETLDLAEYITLGEAYQQLVASEMLA